MQYEPDATMRAEPLSVFEGREAIRAFWQQLIQDGFTDVQYIEPEYRVIDEKCVLLTSRWRMNIAAGVIHKELWAIQDDGAAQLREDHFEVLEQN